MLYRLDRERPLDFADHFESTSILRRSHLLRPTYTRPSDKPDPHAMFAQRRPAGVPGGTKPWLRESNDMVRHIAEAFGIVHPFVNELSELPPHVEQAVRFNAKRSSETMQELQHDALCTLRYVSELQAPVTRQLVARMPPHVRALAGHMDLGLIAAIGDAFPEWPHRSLVYDLVHGFVIVGQPVPDTGLFRPVDRPPTVDPEATLATNADEVLDTARRALAAATRRKAEAAQLIAKTREEVGKGHAIGPFSARQLDGVWGAGGWRPMGRFPVVQKGSLRPCDDAKKSLTNALMHLLETIAPSATNDWMLRVVRLFASINESEARELLFGTNDVAAAYKVIPNGQPWFSTVCAADPETADADAADPLGADLFYIIPGHNFGLASSVTNFNSVMAFATFFSTVFLAAICDHFFDDVGSAGRDQAEQDALMLFFARLGLPFSRKKWTPLGLCKISWYVDRPASPT
jgi:hypothetical protein